MKTIIAALMLALSLQAFAGEVVVFDAPSHELRGISDVKKEFAINKELGRAWVNLTFVPAYNEDMATSEARVKIPGMSFNAEQNTVVLNVSGEEIVCATVKKTFLGTTIRPTGKCTFSTKYYSVKHDNGYEVETIDKVKVTMNF